MEFTLTPEITDEIIFSMEDQTGRFLFDSIDCRCVSTRVVGSSDEDEDRYYAIPVWDSVSGFRMMDRFAARVRNPLVREELRVALTSGHGVFRSFKNIVKSRPEIERMWFQFKEREMRNIVLSWYNSLRDFWGLEQIGMEPEETGEIVAQDFFFRPGTEDDREYIETLVSSVEDEIAEDLPAGLSDALGELWVRIRANPDILFNAHIEVAESSEGELTGVALSSPLPEDSFLSAQIAVLAVYPEFRGLGIGKELLSRTIQHWTDKSYRWLVFASPVVSPVFHPALHRSGFVEKGHVSVLNLAEPDCH